MFKTLFILIYFVLTAYIYWRLALRVKHKHLLIRLLTFATLCGSFLMSFLWAEKLPFEVNFWAHQVSHFWLFSFAYTIPISIGFHIYSLFTKNKQRHPSKYFVWAMMLLGSGILVWGYRQYKKIEVVELEIPVKNWDADHEPFTLVFASDLHFGYTITRARAKEMMDAILAQNADLILLGGDLIDRSVVPVRQQKIEKELSRLHAKYGVFSVLGNHEGYGDTIANKQFIQECGVQLLIDTAIQIPGIVNLIGRTDLGRNNYTRAAALDTVRPDDFRKTLVELKHILPADQQVDSPHRLPTILLDHIPKIPSIEQLEGIDLMLSGHTHNGQIFPFNLILKATNELSYGAKKKGNTLLYVTSGLGLWGARFRLGTQSEIVKIRFVPVQGKKLQLLFTSDMHSQLVSQRTSGLGGFARIASAIQVAKNNFHGQTLVVDAGDFLMGTKYHTLFTSGPVEPVLMQKMGYEAVTIGNHEFDFTALGFENAMQKLLDHSVNQMLVMPNLLLTTERQKKWKSLSVPKTKIIRKCIAPGDTLRIGIFSILGKGAILDAPTAGIQFSDPIEHANACVRELQLKKADLIVVLSHNGTSRNNKENDYFLAKKVKGIDVIVSGHSHIKLFESVVIPSQKDGYIQARSKRDSNKSHPTTIVSAGSQGAYLGQLILAKDQSQPQAAHSQPQAAHSQPQASTASSKTEASGWRPIFQRLIPMDSSIKDEPVIAARIKKLSPTIDHSYFEHFGFRADDPMVESTHVFPSLGELQSHFGDNPVAQLITDAFVYAGKKYEANITTQPIDNNIPTIAVLGMGNLRATLPYGTIRTEDVFNLLSFGSGPDGLPGFPLICAYLTKKEILTLCEMDANIGSKYGDFQLQFCGLKYYSNPYRPLFNKVYKLELPKSKLYRVITNLYAAQRLRDVEKLSYGILKISPKDESGKIIGDMENQILRNPQGIEIKEWVAVCQYLKSHETPSIESKLTKPHSTQAHKTSATPALPQQYTSTEFRKNTHPKGFLSTLWTIFGKYNLSGWIQAITLFVGVFFLMFVLRRMLYAQKK